MKLAVYAIAKDEAHFVKRFMDSCNEADLVQVLDTGSSDETIELLRSHGAQVIDACRIIPWRFDDARNISLAMLPADIDFCIKLDLDEVLLPGYRHYIEEIASEFPEATRIAYRYDWSPTRSFFRDECHTRHGYVWRYPCHETLHWYGDVADGRKEVIARSASLHIQHFPDTSKSRSSYLPLLELAVRENPTSPQHLYWLGREYMLNGQRELATQQFENYLTLENTWPIERAAVMRDLASCCTDDSVKLRWLYDSLRIYNCREGWYAVANLQCQQRRWKSAMNSLDELYAITQQPDHYLSVGTLWSEAPDRMREEVQLALATDTSVRTSTDIPLCNR